MLLNQFFWPDAAPTGQLLAAVAAELAVRGCEVTVVCGDSGYADRSVHSDRSLPVVAQCGAVRVVRVGTRRFRRSNVGRVLSYATYVAGVVWRTLRMERVDLVVTMTTPPMLSVVGSMLARRMRARHCIWEMDLYPDIAVALGVRGVGALQGIADRQRRRADAIVVLGECMRRRLVERGIAEEKIHVCENWADGGTIRPRLFPMAEDPFTLLYSGNLGLAHEVETLQGALGRVGSDRRYRFVVAGEGPRRADLEEFCRSHGVSNVEWESYCTREELGRHLGRGHVGLVTQRRETVGCVVPSKVYAILAAGRGVVYVGPRESTAARILEQHGCGWRVEPGDVRGLVELLHRLRRNRAEVEVAGERGRAAFERHYDEPIGVARVLEAMGVERGTRVSVAAGA